jgi:hypothetical protein
MEFNRLVFQQLREIFEKNGLSVISEFKDYLKLKSDKIVISFSHNDLDNSNLFSVGKKDDVLYPINDDVLKNVFNTELRFENVTKEDFVSNLAFFLNDKGSLILSGNNSIFEKIVDRITETSEVYTKKILLCQLLDQANNDWKSGRYNEFVQKIDKIDTAEIPSAFKLKYKIAMQKRNI